MLAVIAVVAITAVLIFLIYSILRVAFKTKEPVVEQQKEIPYKASFDEGFNEETDRRMADLAALKRANEVQAVNSEDDSNQNTSTIVEPQNGTETRTTMPDVAGQSEEELKAPEPLQERVSSKAETNSAMDPYENNDSSAMFGSNLRHPEASIERTSGNFGNLENEIVAGLASQVSKPTDLDKVQFSAEMAQNGGEFMNGIFAYDSGEGGSYFSSL